MAVVAATMMVACGNNSEKAADDAAQQAADQPGVIEEVETLEVTEVVSDEEAPGIMDKIKAAANPEEIKAYVTKGIEYVKGLINQGKLDEAKKYLEQLKPYAEKVNMGGMVDKVNVAIDKAKALKAADNAIDEAKEAGSKAIDVVKEKGAQAVDATKEAGAKAVDVVKDKGGKAVDAVKDGAVDAYDAVRNLGK